jgi:hypothetical protein
VSARCPRRSLGALRLGLAAAGCSSESPRGSVMLAISTDLYVDKDVSRVDILVQPEHGPAQSTQVNLFPALEGQYLPGTFAIIEGNEPGEFVRVRLIARQGERTRVVREAALKVPRERTALLTMPIQWLCDGRVRQDGQQARSDCDEGLHVHRRQLQTRGSSGSAPAHVSERRRVRRRQRHGRRQLLRHLALLRAERAARAGPGALPAGHAGERRPERRGRAAAGR